MNLEDYRKEFQKRKPAENFSISGEINTGTEDLIEKIRKQETLDEQNLIRNKILPVSVGLIILIIVFLTTRISHPLLLAGATLVCLSLIAILYLFSLDYRNISRERFDVSLIDFLRRKKERLLQWKSTPVLHTVIFGFFSVGLLMMILGNTHLVRQLSSAINILVYIGLNVAILAISWFIGEYKKRKRYRQQHKPLITDISMLIDALTNGEDVG